MGELNTKNINDAIMLHPVKDPAYMYRLHVYSNNERIQDLQQRGEELQRVLRKMDRLLQANRLSLYEKRGLQDARHFHHQLAINNSEKWEMFTSKSFYADFALKAPVTKILGALKIEVNNILEKEKKVINEEFWKNQHLEKLKDLEIRFGYRRFHPLYGIQHIVQLTAIGAKKHLNKKTGETKTIHIPYERRFYTQQPFANLRYTTEPLAGMPPYVHFLVPLEGRLETFRRFMANFELVCLKVLQRVKLVVAYSSSVSSPHEHKDIMRKYQEKYPEADLIWLDVVGNFSRGIRTYGPACIYHQDMDAVGGFDTNIRGWGLEDLKLFDKFVHRPEIQVFRAADPGVIHVYHRKYCDPKLSGPQLTACRGSKASVLASQKSLVRALLST